MAAQPHLFAGTSGYSYKEWNSVFYPHKLPASQRLAHYALYLNSVEINSSFYRIPKAQTLLKWRRQVPLSFRFVVKASRRITHFSRLSRTSDTLAYFLDVVSALEEQLGAVLLQLPPDFPADADKLAAFLERWPSSIPAAFEFRHPSWNSAKVDDLLEQSQACRVLADTDTAPLSPQRFLAFGSWGYLRLRRSTYSDVDLRTWSHALSQCHQWSHCFAFFKHETNAPAQARQFAKAYQQDRVISAGEFPEVPPPS